MTASVKSPKEKPGSSRADQVYAQIRDAVHAGRYTPGERVREAEVAKWLNVSRTPVREAFRRLESDGILTFESWRGVVVADLDRQQVNELYAMREVLEGAAARLAAHHIGAAEVELLDTILERADGVQNNPEKLAHLNRQFHEIIYAAARNRYLNQTLEQLRNALSLLKGTTFGVEDRALSAAREHRAILDAIKERNGARAEEAARLHIAAAHRARLRLMIDAVQFLGTDQK